MYLKSWRWSTQGMQDNNLLVECVRNQQRWGIWSCGIGKWTSSFTSAEFCTQFKVKEKSNKSIDKLAIGCSKGKVNLTCQNSIWESLFSGLVGKRWKEMGFGKQIMKPVWSIDVFKTNIWWYIHSLPPEIELSSQGSLLPLSLPCPGQMFNTFSFTKAWKNLCSLFLSLSVSEKETEREYKQEERTKRGETEP